MKKKIVAILVGVMASALLVGCGDSTGTTSSTSSSDFSGTPVDYANLELEEPALIEVTDEDIDTAFETLLAANVQYTEVTDRTVEEGDTVNIDYVGYLDDVAFDGGTAEGQELEIGSDTYIDGFEDGLIGCNVGDEVSLELTFSDDYYSEDLAGQDVVFVIVINAIYETYVPELTDELIQEISDTCTTVEEYEAELRATYEADNLTTQADAKKSLVWTAIVEGTTVDEYPEEEVAEIETYLYELYEYYASLYGMEIEDYIALYGMTEEDYATTVREAAEQTYISDTIIKYIGEQEGLVPTDEEYQAEIDSYVELYGYTDEDSFYEAMALTRDDMELEILSTIVLDWLVENTTFVPATDTTEE